MRQTFNPAFPTGIVDDVMWSWWTRPRAVHLDGHLYLGFVQSDGGIAVTDTNLSTSTEERFVLGTFEDDDHNNPAIVVTADKPIVAVYCRHNLDNLLRIRRSTAPLDVSAWEAETTINAGDKVTYAQVFPQGDTLHVFTRVGSRGWSYFRSTDWGLTWSARQELFALPDPGFGYMAAALLSDGDTLRCVFSGHPMASNADWHAAWYFEIGLSTGDVLSEGTTVGNVQDGTNLPVGVADVQKIWEAPAGRFASYVWDVSDGPNPEVLIATKDDDENTTVDSMYHYLVRVGGSWQVRDIVAAGGIFGYTDQGMYLGGAAFPTGTLGGELYLSRGTQGDLWRVEKWSTADNGDSWSTTELAISGARIVRPWAVDNPTLSLPVVWLRLRRYGDTYFNWLANADRE